MKYINIDNTNSNIYKGGKEMKDKLKFIIPVVIAVVLITIIIIMNKGISEKECIGTWKITNDDKYYIQSMVLYKGGTGKGFGKGEDESGNHYWEISWEIKDNILNITVGSSVPTTTGYELEKNTITSVDGPYSYNKVK